jgi:hypothetical protein
MVKKLLIAFGVLAAVIVVGVAAAGVMIYLTVDKAFIAAKMSQALNRQVSIGDIDAGIFSVVSGIDIKNVAISNFKTPEALAGLQGKPVTGDLFAAVEALRFKVKIFPLFKRQVELKELVLYSPVINLVRNKQGILNIDDLMKSRKPADGKEPAPQEPARPISADLLPVAMAVGEIGMKNGTINYHDDGVGQKIQIYKLTTLLRDIRIDPQALEQKNEIQLQIGMGVKTIGALKTGSVESFDVTIDAAGKVIPFDVKTRLLDPEVLLHVAVPYGEITGLQIFNAFASMPVLGDYLGRHLAFLKEKQQWKGAKQNSLDLRYKASQVDVKNGRLNLQDAGLSFDGSMNLNTQAVDMNLGVVLAKEINDAARVSLAKQIEAAIQNPEVRKYADSGKLADLAMQPLLNKDGQIDLKAKIGGTTKKPEVQLTRPQLGSLGKFVKDNAGGLALEAGKDAAKKLLREDQQKLLEDVGGLLKK